MIRVRVKTESEQSGLNYEQEFSRHGMARSCKMVDKILKK